MGRDLSRKREGPRGSFMIIQGDSLEKLKLLEDNSVDSIVTDPPYFLTNSSGSGFMGKEWDSLSIKNAFAEAILRSLKPVFVLDVGNTALENANTDSKNKSSEKSIIALYVEINSIDQKAKLSQNLFSVHQRVLTKAEVLALSKELLPSLTDVIENQPENVMYVIPSLFTGKTPISIVQELVLKLHTESLCEELKTLHTLMEDQKILDVTVATIGSKLESKFTSETNIFVISVENIVLEKRYSVTTSSLIEFHKIIQWITSLRFVRNAMGLFMENPANIQVLSERFHYNWAKECLRVLKPGAHLLAFAGTRTYHPLAKAIQDAGFEIRDQIAWMYGQGFPKSTNVALRIDKENGSQKNRGKGFNTAGQGISLNQNKELRSDHPDYIKPEYKSDQVKQWEGWGTALKPANEPICVARKPLEKGLTVAQNVLKWGTGAINIDECRVGTEQTTTLRNGNSGSHGRYGKDDRKFERLNPPGRWPSNIILDEVAAEMLDEQSGVLKSGSLSPTNNVKATTGWSGGSQENRVKNTFESNSGGASRFFYVAKASKRERGEGNVHPTVKPVKLMEYLIKLVTPKNGTCLDPFMGSGTTGVAAKNLGFKFIGIELNPEYAEIAEKRITNVEFTDCTEQA